MIGIDEVGRGCWAGPLLVVAARQTSALPKGLDDSKKLTKKQRLALIDGIRQSCELGEGWVSAAEIDAMGLTEAMRLAVKRALQAISATKHEELIMDGSINYCGPQFTHVSCVVAADSLHPIVSVASIWAKVRRDAFMTSAAKQFQGYGFECHVGYGTAQHLASLKQLGITELHRLSFKPVKAIYDAC